MADVSRIVSGAGPADLPIIPFPLGQRDLVDHKELVRRLRIKVEFMTQRRRDVSRKERRLPSGVEKLRWIDYVDALARRELAEAEAPAERARLSPK